MNSDVYRQYRKVCSLAVHALVYLLFDRGKSCYILINIVSK